MREEEEEDEEEDEEEAETEPQIWIIFFARQGKKEKREPTNIGVFGAGFLFSCFCLLL